MLCRQVQKLYSIHDLRYITGCNRRVKNKINGPYHYDVMG